MTYMDLILEQIKQELKPTEKELESIIARLKKANTDELERTYEAFYRFGVKDIMEQI